jgi:coenzyme F420-0:L-glutamate ligase/coenzyme F420-1:gamma-L-glutamate ligase
MPAQLVFTALDGLPAVRPGDDLVVLIARALVVSGVQPQAGDVLVVTSKIVSKAEGRSIGLDTVKPGAHAVHVAAITRKDPRMVELVLRESERIVRAAPGILVVRHRLGFVSANAGIDQSNTAEGDAAALLLPEDPDASARRLRDGLAAAYALSTAALGVVLSDSHGRPHRRGNVGVAIGSAGVPALLDRRGQPDLFGRALKITIAAAADPLAGAAGLLGGEGSEGRPVVHVRGLTAVAGFALAPAVSAADAHRPPEEDRYLDGTGPLSHEPVS